MFFDSKEPFPPLKPLSFSISIEKEGKKEWVEAEKIIEKTGARFTNDLQFSSFQTYQKVLKWIEKLKKRGDLSKEQVWLGAYFRKELEEEKFPDVTLSWIDDDIGWGVFASRSFKKFTYITRYSGLLKKRKRKDRKNAYCFEYVLAPGIDNPYTIDAKNQGGISRYLNHSKKPNLVSAVATFQGISYIIFYTDREVKEGEQLTYDYGPDYWKKRVAPRNL